MRRVLRGAIARCVLQRRDGSLFARLLSDRRQRVLEVAFFRRDGTLRRATGAVYAATPSDTGGSVGCESSSQAAIGPKFWTTTRGWSIGATPAGIEPGQGDQGVARRDGRVDEQRQPLRDRGPGGATDVLRRRDEPQGRAGRGVGRRLGLTPESDQDCKGALACTVTAYDAEGNPVESDTRFNTHYKWSLSGAKNAYDIQSVAAHEFGHILQFDHVQSEAKNDQSAVMWPYVEIGDISGRKLGRGDALGNNSRY